MRGRPAAGLGGHARDFIKANRAVSIRARPATGEVPGRVASSAAFLKFWMAAGGGRRGQHARCPAPVPQYPARLVIGQEHRERDRHCNGNPGVGACCPKNKTPRRGQDAQRVMRERNAVQPSRTLSPLRYQEHQMRGTSRRLAQVRHRLDALLDGDAVHVQVADAPFPIVRPKQADREVGVDHRVLEFLERLEAMQLHDAPL